MERGSPYPGLQPFFVDDVAFFSGRARDVRLIVASLFASPLTLLYGPGGVGKSSVLHAGVLPRLAERRNVVVVSVRDWTGDPVRAIGEAAAGAAGTDFDGDLAATLAACSGNERRRVMLVLDQFEHAMLERDAEDALVESLSAALLHPGLRVSALIAIREDALAELDRFDGRVPGLFDTVLRLEYLDRAAGADAIRRPLDAWERLTGEHVEVEDALVDAVLDAVPAGRAADGIETAQLQLVMARVWKAERDAGSSRLRRETFVALGGADGIVRAHVRDALDGMAAADRELAAVVLDRLVTPSGARIAHLTDDLARYAGSEAATLRPVLERLSTARVLRPVAAAGKSGARFEVYHELLADAVLAWLTDHAADRRAAIASVRLRKRILSLAAVLVVAVAVAVVLAGVLIDEKRSSETARSRADSGTADRLLRSGGDPQLALALALRAADTRPTREAELALRAVLAQSYERKVLRSGSGGVLSVDVSRDGRTLLAAEAAGRVRVRDRATGRPLRTLPAAGALDAAFCPDGERVALAGEDGATLVSGNARTRIARARVEAIACSADGARVAARLDERARVLDARSGTLVASLSAPSSGVPGRIALSADGRLVAVPVESGTIVADLRARAARAPLRLRDGEEVTSVAFSPDGRRVVTGGARGRVLVWDLDRGTRVIELRGDASFVSSVAFGPDGTLVLAAAGDRTARVWDVASGVQIAELRGHEGDVGDATFAPDGRTVATASEDGTLRLWRLPLAGLLRPERDVAFGAFADDGRSVVTASADGTIEVWDAPRGRRTARFAVPGVQRIAVAPDARSVAVVEASGRVRAWRPARPASPIDLAGPDDPVLALDYRADGKAIALATESGAIHVLASSGETLREVRAVGLGPLRDVAFSPDGTRIAAAAADGTAIAVIDARNGRSLRRIRPQDEVIGSLAFSPDGSEVIAGGLGGASIWDAGTGRLRLQLRGHGSAVGSASFSAGGELIATADAAGVVRVWDATSGESIVVLAGRGVVSFGGDRYLMTIDRRLTRLYDCDACGPLAALRSRGRRIVRPFTERQLAQARGG